MSDLALRSKAGTQAMAEGRFEEAVTIYRELLKARPDDPGLLMNLGMALAMAGREAEALPPLQRAASLNPGLIPAHLFLGSSYLALGQPQQAIAPLKRVIAAQPRAVEHRRMLAEAYAALGRSSEAVGVLREITELAPKEPGGWYALGHAYNAVTQDALGAFEKEPENSPWRQLLLADAFASDGRLTDAFALYRSTIAELPAMVSIHDSIAKIYERTGHADWAALERAKGMLPPGACVKRKALCAFRAGQYRTALAAAMSASDLESSYWRARAATELALASFKRLDALPDSRERREVRATMARGERRYPDAIKELEAALKFAPGDPGLVDDLGTSYYSARDYDRALSTLAPLVKHQAADARLLTVYGDSLFQLQRVDEAIAFLQRAVQRDPEYAMARLTLGRAYAQKGDHAAAIPLIESQLAQDTDGSLHVLLARTYTAIGQKDRATALLERSQELQRRAQEHAAAQGQRTISPPK